MNKNILWAIGGFVAGAVTGALVTKVVYEKKFDQVADDIYNECYASAIEEAEQRVGIDRMNLQRAETRIEHAKEELLQKQMETGIRITPNDKPSLEELAKQQEEIDESDDPDVIMFPANRGETGIICQNDFTNNEYDHDNIDLYFYPRDEVFTDQDDEIIGDDVIPDFDMHRGILIRELRKEPGTAYLRSAELKADFEIHRLQGAFSEIEYETPKERQTRLTRRNER